MPANTQQASATDAPRKPLGTKNKQQTEREPMRQNQTIKLLTGIAILAILALANPVSATSADTGIQTRSAIDFSVAIGALPGGSGGPPGPCVIEDLACACADPLSQSCYGETGRDCMASAGLTRPTEKGILCYSISLRLPASLQQY
ncbi:MAG: hypothetical protein LC623_09885 [Halobacteriales archaeon]|nr:hypothetical protein [Halobacteriales archaeon]